ncbi:MAG: hypothetical protein HKN72_00210 [Gemmatimonadetes bacterium]|nr:hypothetical protein [Gemmatimonadota bacterium]NNF11614.1 hypothetical protein [Gemmatimonadota bacterium]
MKTTRRRLAQPKVSLYGILLLSLGLVGTTPSWAVSPLHAQGLGAGVHVQSYSFDDATIAGVESVRLFVTPFAAVVDFGRGTLGLSGAYANGSATGPSGVEASLSGLTDTDLVLTYRPGPDWLLVSASSALPTGKASLGTEGSFVAAFIAAELLPFEIDSWGSGGDVGGDVAVATQAGAWGVGLSAGYRLAGEYEPVPELPFAYKPGNQLQLRVALDRDVSHTSTLSFLLGLQHFTDDELEGTNLFKSGTRLQALGSYAFPVGLRSSALVFGGLNHRANGALLTEEAALSGATDSPSQQLFMAGVNLRFPLGRGAAILPRAELFVFRAEDGASQGWVGSVGPAVDLRVSGNATTRQFFLTPSFVLRTGNVIVQEGSESGFSGWEVGVTLRLVDGL